MCNCTVIGKKLKTPDCPLQAGACMWQHRKTHECKATIDQISKDEFAAMVGLPPITDDEYENRKSCMVTTLKNEL